MSAEPRWTDCPHLRLKLVLGFVLGAIFVTSFAFFAVPRLASDPDQLSPGLLAVSTLIGWTVAYPH